MIKHSIWVLEQEYRFAKEQFDWGEGGRPTLEDDPWWIFAGITAAAVQTSAISALPYYGIIQLSGRMDDYVFYHTIDRAVPIAFRFGAGIKGFQPVFRSAARRGLLLGARVGSRAIPYVGWALLAYDLYSVGKWAHDKLSD